MVKKKKKKKIDYDNQLDYNAECKVFKKKKKHFNIWCTNMTSSNQCIEIYCLSKSKKIFDNQTLSRMKEIN